MLTSKEVKEFKKQANRMQDHLVIGHSGLNDARIKKIKHLFESKSLLKIVVNKTAKENKTQIINKLKKIFHYDVVLLSGKKFLLASNK